MTREEAKSCIGTIEMLQRLAYNIHGVMDVIDADNCKKIIKALEQEPTTKNDLVVDCISRADAIHAVSEALKRTFVEYEDVANIIIGKLPSVTPQPRKGHWIIDGHHRKCPICDEYFCIKDAEGNEIPSSFCPNCGAKMVEPQESEG